MLGIVFTEFMEMVETQFSEDLLDDVLDSCNLASGGSYTSVGYYDYKEMIQLVMALSKQVNVPVDELIEAFGTHMFGVLGGKYPVMLEGYATTLDFLESVDGTVHKEVLKLYPDAELPHFSTERKSQGHLVMHYKSRRPFSNLALGLIKGSAQHFDEVLEISFTSSQDESMYRTDFDIRVADE